MSFTVAFESLFCGEDLGAVVSGGLSAGKPMSLMKRLRLEADGWEGITET